MRRREIFTIKFKNVTVLFVRSNFSEWNAVPLMYHGDIGLRFALQLAHVVVRLLIRSTYGIINPGTHAVFGMDGRIKDRCCSVGIC